METIYQFKMAKWWLKKEFYSILLSAKTGGLIALATWAWPTVYKPFNNGVIAFSLVLLVMNFALLLYVLIQRADSPYKYPWER